MQLNFFNTIHLSGNLLKEAETTANKQEARILSLMREGYEYTPFDVQELYRINFSDTPITSIRRAMTCLTDKGKLIKCDNMKQGQYGKPNHTWRKL